MTPTLVKHQIVIVGGGVTGLTLAVMLQHLRIDYVLLEAYGSVTPNAGASIELHANGLRILDQLGICDDFLSQGQPTKVHHWRDAETGKPIMSRGGTIKMKERHGYPSTFMARYDFLCILHKHVREKHRILVNRRVIRVDNRHDAAMVYTEDGTVFECQMVVGADGVRSFVRGELWRNADEQHPGIIADTDRGTIPCEHACVFGTAKPKEGIDPGGVSAVCGSGVTAGLMGAHNKDIFFFWFWSLPKSKRTCSISDIPRFTETDKQREMARCAELVVADNGLRFGEVVQSLRFSGVTALPHFVLRRWHFGRIIIIGDAAHKFNPLIGQGGNSCIESCASLVNSLQHIFKPVQLLSDSPLCWAQTDLEKVFVMVEKQRISRLQGMVERSQGAMRRVSWETWMAKFALRHIAPSLPATSIIDFYSSFITGGVSLQGLFPSPAVTHAWPYDDEKQVAERRRVFLSKASVMLTAIPPTMLITFMIARVLVNQ